MGKYISKEKREKVYRRANGYCEYCKTPVEFIPDPNTIEHIQPTSKDGSDELKNLALACFGCNLYKNNKTKSFDSLTETITPLYHPRLDNWNEHFQWSEDFTKLIGLSPKGRATIQALKLNRPRLSNLRILLAAFGEIPPKE